ncbi:hypothetical protein [Listeria valentina]|uniref:hypothetical protein n=1 Tax=Listeria valentina TaxID=2705293 RepID=UPI00142FC0E9|nr:hypothetical protein [Listeria valentina]
MKKNGLILGLLISCLILLVACGEQDKYNEAIEKAIKRDKEFAVSIASDKEIKEMKRENAQVKVYDDGKYIYIKFNNGVDEGYFKKDSDENYDFADYDEEQYVKEDAKLVYTEKNGEPQ